MNDEILAQQMVILYPEEYSETEYQQAQAFLAEYAPDSAELAFIDEMQTLRSDLDHYYQLSQTSMAQSSILSTEAQAAILHAAENKSKAVLKNQKIADEYHQPASWWQAWVSPQFAAFATLSVLALLISIPTYQSMQGDLDSINSLPSITSEKEIHTPSDRVLDKKISDKAPADEMPSGKALSGKTLSSNTLKDSSNRELKEISKRQAMPKGNNQALEEEMEEMEELEAIKTKKSVLLNQAERRSRYAALASKPSQTKKSKKSKKIRRRARNKPMEKRELTKRKRAAREPVDTRRARNRRMKRKQMKSKGANPKPSRDDRGTQSKKSKPQWKPSSPPPASASKHDADDVSTLDTPSVPWQSAAQAYQSNDIQQALSALLAWVDRHEKHARRSEAIQLGIRWARSINNQYYLVQFQSFITPKNTASDADRDAKSQSKKIDRKATKESKIENESTESDPLLMGF